MPTISHCFYDYSLPDQHELLQIPNLKHCFIFLAYRCMCSIVCQIWMFCCEEGRKYPQNIRLTSFFSLNESYMVSFIYAATGMQSENSLMLMAALMTLAVIF
jgi:hypothetical protein